MPVPGFFVDWDGNTRRVEAPGDGLSCVLRQHDTFMGVDVLESDGGVCHEAVFYPSLDALRAVGVSINLVG